MSVPEKILRYAKVPYVTYRGGAGISKVVRPFEIKDHSCLCTGGCGFYTGLD